VPRLRKDMLHTLESVTFSIFAPIFFGIVGLKVDLWKLGDGTMLLTVLGVATAGKLVGCTAGSLLGGLRIWESLSIAVAMNARGAMELVVATIGLSLGILNQQMYSIVVMVAVTTSFMAPVLLRLTMKMVRLTEDEVERIAADQARGLFDPEKLRVLVPTAGGPNAMSAAAIGMRVARRSAHPVTVLYVERVTGWAQRLFGRRAEGQNIGQHLDHLRKLATSIKTADPDVRRQSKRDVVETIQQESSKGYDLVMVGASESKRGMRGEKLEKLVAESPCHVAIVKNRGATDGPFSKILVPVDGSFFSRVAVEFAIRYAEGVGDSAEVTLAIETDGEQTRGPSPTGAAAAVGHAPTVPAGRGRANSLLLMADGLSKDGGLEKLSPIFKATKVKTRLVVKGPSDRTSDRLPILEEANEGGYDLMVLGAENRAIHYRLFFGYQNEKVVEESKMTVVLVVPKMRTN
jgi:nucleotide-binding universal stress UspA family protein